VNKLFLLWSIFGVVSVIITDIPAYSEVIWIPVLCKKSNKEVYIK